MQDGIISGNGNSRYLKTVSTALGLYPTYEDFMAALIAGTFPIDLNGINTAGWTQQGTLLNKANLLTDATCSALGIAITSTPNDALSRIKNLIDSANANANTKIQMQIVSYVGTGVYGQSNPCTISANFPIQIAYSLGYRDNKYWRTTQLSSDSKTVVIPNDGYITQDYTRNEGFYLSNGSGNYGKCSNDHKTIQWYNAGSQGYQLNLTNYKYFFLILG